MSPAQREWNEAMTRLLNVSGGIVQTAAFLDDDLPELQWAADAGDRTAEATLASIQHTKRRVATARRGERPGCVLCHRLLHPRRFSFGVVIPHGIEEVPMALVFGICKHCCPDRTMTETTLFKALRDLWPDLRKLNISKDEGRA